MAVRPVKNVTAPDRKKSTVRRCAPEQPLLRKVCGSGACRAGMLHVPVHLYFYTFVKQLSISILFKFTAKKAFVLCQFTKAPRRAARAPAAGAKTGQNVCSSFKSGRPPAPPRRRLQGPVRPPRPGRRVFPARAAFFPPARAAFFPRCLTAGPERVIVLTGMGFCKGPAEPLP